MITEGWMIVGKLACFVIIGIVGPVALVVEATAKFDYWPSRVKIVAAILAGSVSAANTVLAFFNNSWGDYKTRLNGAVVAHSAGVSSPAPAIASPATAPPSMVNP